MAYQERTTLAGIVKAVRTFVIIIMAAKKESPSASQTTPPFEEV
jgi:hypothetical protein